MLKRWDFFFAVNCILFCILISFLLIDFPCKLAVSEFIDKQISPVKLPVPCFQSPGFCFLSCMSEFSDVPRREFTEGLPVFNEAAVPGLSPSIGTIRTAKQVPVWSEKPG